MTFGIVYAMLRISYPMRAGRFRVMCRKTKDADFFYIPPCLRYSEPIGQCANGRNTEFSKWWFKSIKS